MKTKWILSLSMMVLLAAGSGYGQQPSLTATIDFPFTIMGKALSAGSYEFTRDSGSNYFRVTGKDKVSVMAAVITRIAGAMHTTPQDAHIVFDVVGDTAFLSEIWIPGDDGYLMVMTKDKHEHKMINVKR